MTEVQQVKFLPFRECRKMHGQHFIFYMYECTFEMCVGILCVVVYEKCSMRGEE